MAFGKGARFSLGNPLELTHSTSTKPATKMESGI